MEFKSNVNADCCTPTGKYELCGCVSGVPYIQLTVVGGGTVQTAWLNTETGDTFTSKPAGFLTGTCSEASASDVLKFSGSAPTGTTPFASPKDGYTTVVTDDGTATGDVTGIYLYDAESATWVKVPSTPLGGTEGQVLTAHADGSRTWEDPAVQAIMDDQVLTGDNTTNTTVTLTPTTVADQSGGDQVNYTIKAEVKVDGTTIVENATTHVLSAKQPVITDTQVSGHTVATVTDANGVATAIKETITDITGVLTAGTQIGTYHKEDGSTVDLYAPSALDVLGTTQPTPTATGNTSNLNSVFKDANGDTWIVDANGDAIKAGSAAVAPTGVNVYFNSDDPTTATIFDDVNPPVTDDASLKNDSNNTYYGTDGSTWTYNSSSGTYVTKTYSFPTWRFTAEFATALQTSKTLPSTPIATSTLSGSRGLVHVTRNGIDISRAWSWVGPVGTYNPAQNFSANMDAGDLLQFHWEAY